MYKINELYELEQDYESLLSDLELMVMVDMDMCGYDPDNYHDVLDYWKERLS